MKKGFRFTHCRKGHKYTEESSYVNSEGHRRCRVCAKENHKEWYRNNKSRHKENRVRWNKTNLEKVQLHSKKQSLGKAFWTIEEFYKTLLKQDGKCAICKIPLVVDPSRSGLNKACADHDHKTNMPREILCRGCNNGLGFFLDSPELMKNAIKYIRKHAASNARKEI